MNALHGATLNISEDTKAQLPTLPETLDLSALACRIGTQRTIVDANLRRATRWRGQLRRQIHGYAELGEGTKYARAYNRLVAAESDHCGHLDVGALRRIHGLAVGGTRFRKVVLTVGGNHRFPSPADVPGLVQKVLEESSLSSEPCPVVASRLHLRLLTAHPFRDGNGRTARLAATLWLVKGGFRSSLLTAVEQHFHPAPAMYLEILDQFRFGEITEDACVARLLQAMVANAMYATWFRARELRLRACCASLNIPSNAVSETLSSYDTDPMHRGHATALAEAICESETPLHILNETLTTRQRTELSFQVGRLLDEEQDDSQSL